MYIDVYNWTWHSLPHKIDSYIIWNERLLNSMEIYDSIWIKSFNVYLNFQSGLATWYNTNTLQTAQQRQTWTDQTLNLQQTLSSCVSHLMGEFTGWENSGENWSCHDESSISFRLAIESWYRGYCWVLLLWPITCIINYMYCKHI